MFGSYKQAIINYSLPSTIQSLQEGWQYTYKAGIILSCLFAVVATQFLNLFKNTGYTSQEGQTALLLLCYISLFFNISAATGAFILLDRLGELTYRASQKRQSRLPQEGTVVESADSLLKRFGAGALWTLLTGHWVLCFLGGIVCILLQVLTYVWLQESQPVQITITCLAAFSVLPLVTFIIPSND